MYSDFAQKYGNIIKENIYNALYDRPSLQALLPDLTKLSLLDLGCGSGEYIQYYLDNNVESIIAVDQSNEMVNIVKNRFQDKVHCYQSDLNFPLINEQDNSFDIITSALVIHYIKDLPKLFKEVSRLLKPKGIIHFFNTSPFS